MDEHCFLYSSGLAVDFLMHDIELIGIQWMSCCSALKVYWGGGFQMLLDPVSQ